MGTSPTIVRMGELTASRTSGDVLVSLGLGSCIALALLDRRLGIAGLAHIVLPDSGGRAGGGGAHRFADRAVPALIARLVGLGARRGRLEAVVVGGASMFAVGGPSLEVGQRNAAAVRELLRRERIPVVREAIGGSRGRTVRVDVAGGGVTVREAGGQDTELLAGSGVLEAVA
jgi:chemotaxis protein CheD